MIIGLNYLKPANRIEIRCVLYQSKAQQDVIEKHYGPVAKACLGRIGAHREQLSDARIVVTQTVPRSEAPPVELTSTNRNAWWEMLQCNDLFDMPISAIASKSSFVTSKR